MRTLANFLVLPKLSSDSKSNMTLEKSVAPVPHAKATKNTAADLVLQPMIVNWFVLGGGFRPGRDGIELEGEMPNTEFQIRRSASQLICRDTDSSIYHRNSSPRPTTASEA